MNWVLHETTLIPSPPPPPPISDPTNLQNKVSPSILLIILILAIIFFISGLLHLLVRCLIKRNTRGTQDLFDNSTTDFQGQLQQLFNLHDSGVDQSFIDTLPIFLYQAIIGLKDPFDCAVCLCEFNQDDKLRLLPKCSHAFHLDCIDTWLLSHSTCPLCRRNLLEYSDSCSPLVFVLESGSENSREIGSVSDRREIAQNTHPASIGDDESGMSSNNEGLQKSAENGDDAKAEIVQVKLGKFRNLETCSVALGEGTSNGTGTGTGNENGTKNLDQRRCYSMGTYEYVMDERSSLHVPIKPPKKKPVAKRPGHRAAMSECDCNSRREGFKGFDKNLKIGDLPKNADVGTRLNVKESFSISKTWLRTKDRLIPHEENSRRAFSFRLPVESNSRSKIENSSPVTESVYNVSTWDKSGSVDWDLESANCENRTVAISRADEAPSFARRTLQWIMGRHEQR